jgi:phosphomannomutase
MSADVMTTARAWLAAEPDADIRTELEALVAGDPDVLAARFAGRLQFGTAGLRAAIGAGPLRMNRLVVRQAAAGLIAYLLREVPDAATKGVIIGFDARHKSDAFALDTARVAAAAGVKAFLLPRPLPTPVLAWNITHYRAAAGVMVTASHNPPADNGYKVYLGTGAQIVPPADVEISALIDQVDPTAVPLAAEDDPLIVRLDDAPLHAYLTSVPGVRLLPELPGVPVAYTAMHGVGGETLVRAFEDVGFPAPAITEMQQQPDPDFPTVSFPNPEEPGAMDLLLAEAERSGAAIALANDPDADRLGAAIPLRAGGWRRLTGDEIGWLLADHILANTTGDDRVVITTLVSSSLLAKMAAAAGVHHAETYTGFKWIAHHVLTHPEQRFVFGYEQALGYLVTGRPLDKDGITAAVLLAEVAAAAVADGRTVEDLLDGIAERFGRYVTAELSVRMNPVDAAAKVAALQASPPATLAGAPVAGVEWFAEANLLRLMVDGPDGAVRAQIRPSGTEPKVKLYGEAVGADPGPYLTDLAAALDAAE